MLNILSPTKVSKYSRVYLVRLPISTNLPDALGR